jgi:hypothetical protein
VSRGGEFDPMDVLLPLGDLPSCYHVLGVGLGDLNSVNATVLVSQKTSECFAIVSGIRKLAAANGPVADAALGEVGNPYVMKPYQIIENKRFDINKLGLTRRPKVFHLGPLAFHYPVSIMASHSGCPWQQW